jgi:hypothetical protein
VCFEMRWIGWVGIHITLLAGCGAMTKAQTTQAAARPQEKPAPATPMAEEKAALGDDETWDPAWDKIVEDRIPASLLFTPKISKDVRAFCPRFKAMSEADKRAYWAYFFQALSGAEAGLRPTANVRHTEPEVAVKDGVTHRMVRSEGLLQLTYEDAERYGCEFDWASDKDLPEHAPEKTILQPKNNLDCGVRILTNQLIDRRKPLLSKSSYWSVLRPKWPGYSAFLKQMSNVPAACGRLQPREAKMEAKDAPASKSSGDSPSPTP